MPQQRKIIKITNLNHDISKLAKTKNFKPVPHVIGQSTADLSPYEEDDKGDKGSGSKPGSKESAGALSHPTKRAWAGEQGGNQKALKHGLHRESSGKNRKGHKRPKLKLHKMIRKTEETCGYYEKDMSKDLKYGLPKSPPLSFGVRGHLD